MTSRVFNTLLTSTLHILLKHRNIAAQNGSGQFIEVDPKYHGLSPTEMLFGRSPSSPTGSRRDHSDSTSTSSESTADQRRTETRMDDVFETKSDSDDGYQDNSKRASDENRGRRRSAPVQEHAPLHISEITGSAVRVRGRTVRAINSVVNQLLAVPVYFSELGQTIRNDELPGPIDFACKEFSQLKDLTAEKCRVIINNYIATKADNPNGTFLPGTTQSAKARAIKAITKLVAHPKFKSLSLEAQYVITQELMTYSIRTQGNSVQIVKVNSIRNARIYDSTLIDALPQVSLSLPHTKTAAANLPKIFQSAIDALSAIDQSNPEESNHAHPFNAARDVPAHIVNAVFSSLITARQEPLKTLTLTQQRDVLVRIALELIQTQYEFKSSKTIDLLIASLTVQTSVRGAETSYPQLSKLKAALNDSAPSSSSHRQLVRSQDVFRFLHCLDNFGANSRQVDAETIIRQVFPRHELAAPLARIIRKYPLIFDTDPFSGSSTGTSFVTDSQTWTSTQSRSSIPDSGSTSTLTMSGAKASSNPVEAILGNKNAKLFMDHVLLYSETSYDDLNLPSYGVPGKLVDAIKELSPSQKATIEVLIYTLLPTDTEPDQDVASPSRAQLFVEHLGLGNQTEIQTGNTEIKTGNTIDSKSTQPTFKSIQHKLRLNWQSTDPITEFFTPLLGTENADRLTKLINHSKLSKQELKELKQALPTDKKAYSVFMDALENILHSDSDNRLRVMRSLGIIADPEQQAREARSAAVEIQRIYRGHKTRQEIKTNAAAVEIQRK